MTTFNPKNDPTALHSSALQPSRQIMRLLPTLIRELIAVAILTGTASRHLDLDQYIRSAYSVEGLRSESILYLMVARCCFRRR